MFVIEEVVIAGALSVIAEVVKACGAVRMNKRKSARLAERWVHVDVGIKHAHRLQRIGPTHVAPLSAIERLGRTTAAFVEQFSEQVFCVLCWVVCERRRALLASGASCTPAR